MAIAQLILSIDFHFFLKRYIVVLIQNYTVIENICICIILLSAKCHFLTDNKLKSYTDCELKKFF